MNRAGFFKRLFGGITGAALPATVVLPEPFEPFWWIEVETFFNERRVHTAYGIIDLGGSLRGNSILNSWCKHIDDVPLKYARNPKTWRTPWGHVWRYEFAREHEPKPLTRDEIIHRRTRKI